MRRISPLNGSIPAAGGSTRGGLRRFAPDSMVMHPGPDEPWPGDLRRSRRFARSTVLEQVANGVSVRMAVLYLLLAGERAGEQRHDDEREDGR